MPGFVDAKAGTAAAMAAWRRYNGGRACADTDRVGERIDRGIDPARPARLEHHV
jgi:hypothetical protein